MDPDWPDCFVAFTLRGLSRPVISVKVPLVFPPGDMPISTPSSAPHWFIAHAAKVLLLVQQVQDKTERYLETTTAKLGCKRDTTGTPWCSMRLRAAR
jgi:hypothetical protein